MLLILYVLAPRQVTISTVGVLSSMYSLSQDIPQVNLALSLHAPNQSTRLKIVPTAAASKIDKLMDALDNHILCNQKKFKSHDIKNRINVNRLEDNCNHIPLDSDSNNEIKRTKKYTTCVMIEYILISNINDQPEHAHELGKLLESRRDNILLNLIPYNPTSVAEEYFPPSNESVNLFSRICQSEPYLIHTRIRQEMGQDIAGACGQLALVNKNKSNSLLKDIEDFSYSDSKIRNEVKVGNSNHKYHWIAINAIIPFIALLVSLSKTLRI